MKKEVGMTGKNIKEQGRNEENEKIVGVSSMLELEDRQNITIPILENAYIIHITHSTLSAVVDIQIVIF